MKRNIILSGALVTLLVASPLAFSHFQSDYTKTFSAGSDGSTCIEAEGDACANTMQADADNKSIEGKLAITSTRMSESRSVQLFTVTYGNSFHVSEGTKQIFFNTTWTLKGVAQATGGFTHETGETAEGHCFLRQGDQNKISVYTDLLLVDGSVVTVRPLPVARVDKKIAKTEIFEPQGRTITVFSELVCFVKAASIANVELELMEGTKLEHFHVTDQDGQSLPELKNPS